MMKLKQQNQIYSFEGIILKIVAYFEFYGALLLFYFLFISRFNFNFCFLMITDYITNDILLYFHKNKYLNENNHLILEWIKKYIMIPM